jgi:hypothetical protein
MAILVAGIVFRPPHASPPPASESESLNLQLQAQRRDLERRAYFFANQAEALAPRAEEARRLPGSLPQASPQPGSPILLVTPSSQGLPLWMDTTSAGKAAATCYETSVERWLLASPLSPSFDAGAAFDLDGRLVGIVAECEGRLSLVTPASFTALEPARLAMKLRTSAGFRVALPVDSSGARVVEVARNWPWSTAGLQAGDRIVQVDGSQVQSIEQVRPFLAGVVSELVVRRGDEEVRLVRSEAAAMVSARETPAPHDLGVRWTRGRTARIEAVDPAGLGSRWGLKEGDVVLRAGNVRSPQPRQVEAMLGSGSGELIVLRDEIELLLSSPTAQENGR